MRPLIVNDSRIKAVVLKRYSGSTGDCNNSKSSNNVVVLLLSIHLSIYTYIHTYINACTYRINTFRRITNSIGNTSYINDSSGSSNDNSNYN